MGIPVVTVASGGRPVVWTTAPTALPITEAASGLAVTKVAAGKPGLPVTYVTVGGAIVSPFTPTTWNPADKTSVNLSNGNLTATTTAINSGTRSLVGFNAGKFYWEITISTWGGANTGPALGPAGSAYSGSAWAWMNKAGSIFVNGVAGFTLGARTAGDIMCVAVDLGAKLIWFRVGAAGAWNGSGGGNPVTGLNGRDLSALTGPFFPAFLGGAASDVGTANFGGSAFTGTVPSGFTAGWG